MAKTTLTLEERPQREALVAKRLTAGVSIPTIAREVKTTQQAMYKFIKRRDWLVDIWQQNKAP